MTLKDAINFYLNEVCDGDYGFALFLLFVGIAVLALSVVLTVVTKGLILIPVAIVAGVLAAFYWADEYR